MLGDSRRYHSHTRKEETKCDLLDGGKVESSLSDSRVEDEVHDWNGNDDENRVEVVNNIIGDLSKVHGGRLGCQITGHLVVGKPIEREPEEDLACQETTTNFVNPFIVKSHPRWTISRGDVAWLDLVPELWISEIFGTGKFSIVQNVVWVRASKDLRCRRIYRPLAFKCKLDEFESFCHD